MASPSSTTSRDAQKRGSQSSTAAMSCEATTESLVYADQKTKKRMQNRVAQRTYRNRMKQRVQDLEKQLCEMRARQQQQQHFSQRMASKETHDCPISFVPSTSNMRRAQWQQDTPLPRIPGSLQHGTWPCMVVEVPAQAVADFGPLVPDTYITSGFTPQAHYSNLTPLNQLVGLNHDPSAMPSPGQEMASTSPIRSLHIHDSSDSTPNEEIMQRNAHIAYRGTVTTLDQAPEISEKEENYARLSTSPTSWENSPTMMLPKSARAGTVTSHSAISGSLWSSVATAATDVWVVGSTHELTSTEERFVYVLECARRTGFDNFDSMAAQYYTSSFDPGSSLAMDQRLSRSRHLPTLLSEVRQKSAQWSVWERNAYQDEMLRTVEDIYATECREFRITQDLSDVNALSLATIQQKLPNVWTLLSSLASSVPLKRRGDCSSLVYSSIQQLCALGDAPSHMDFDDKSSA